MSLWTIAWRSIQQRGLASLLTMLSMALGVMLVVTVLAVHGVVAESFRNNTSLGYNLIVGPKGGNLQLTLPGRLSQPFPSGGNGAGNV
jgi:putative ABC transport system permease protein